MYTYIAFLSPPLITLPIEVTAEQLLSSLQIKYAVVVVSILPMLLIYPLLSKNLEKGLMIGAVKG